MRVKVKFEIEIPDGLSDDDIEDWLRFELGDNGHMRGDNPLYGTCAEPVFDTFEWKET